MPAAHKLSAMSDEQLIGVLQCMSHDDNMEAFTILYTRHYSKVRGYVRRRLHGAVAADTEDLVQHVFLTLHRTVHRFIKNSYVVGFLIKTASRLIANRLQFGVQQRRDVYRNVRVSRKTLPDTRANEKRAAAEYAQHFLAHLTPAEAEVVRLIDLDGHTAKSAAEIINAPMTTVQWRYRKAWEHLKILAAYEVAAA